MGRLCSSNGVYRAGIHACAAVDAGIRIDSPFLTHFTDGVNRAGIVACAAIDALVGNFVSQCIHLLCINLLLIVLDFSKSKVILSYAWEKIQQKVYSWNTANYRKNLECEIGLRYYKIQFYFS